MSSAEFFYWGPYLVLTKVPDELTNRLNEIGEDLDITKDFRDRLAGRIEKERSFSEENINSVIDYIDPILFNYIESLNTHWRSDDDLKDNYDRSKFYFQYEHIWMNYQREKEYNPIHNHSGDISFVIYNDIPNVIYEEKNNHNSPDPGVISFSYNLYNSSLYHEDKLSEKLKKQLQPIFTQSFKPVTGDMLIFPSYLHHEVSAFMSNVIRKSVAGNVYIRDK